MRREVICDFFFTNFLNLPQLSFFHLYLSLELFCNGGGGDGSGAIDFLEMFEEIGVLLVDGLEGEIVESGEGFLVVLVLALVGGREGA